MIHPNFTGSDENDYNSTVYDLAMLRLKKKIKFSNIVKRARLPSPNDEFKIYRTVKYIGWGRYQPKNNNRSYPLQQAFGTIHFCGQNPDDHWNIYYMCVYGTNSYPCSGDSGGPLLCDEDIVCGIIIGVVEGCYKPGIFTVVR